MKSLAPSDFLNLNVPVLDIRSPGEFHQGHIPGAISFPLFSDEERATVGTIYKEKSREAAIKKGLELVGPKMVAFVESAEELNSKVLNLYCWRGGMRSSSMGWLLEQYGFEVNLLIGGYKAFRNHTFQTYNDKLKLKVLRTYLSFKMMHFIMVVFPTTILLAKVRFHSWRQHLERCIAQDVAS